MITLKNLLITDIKQSKSFNNDFDNVKMKLIIKI